MTRLRQSVVMGLCLFLAGRVMAQAPLFVAEDLQFIVSDTLCQMQGCYQFENKSGQTNKARLFYPFHLDQDSPFPKAYEVRLGEEKTPTPVFVQPRGISFMIEIAPESRQQVWVSYTQAIHNQDFTYILKTTQSWKRPLEHASYEIRIPRHLSLTFCSHEIDTTVQQTDFLIHRIVRENFLPSRDLQIKWGNQP
jgi:hypothetical protein